MTIWHDEAAQAWLVEMRSTAYAFALADDGAALRHLHWGAALPREALASLADGTRGIEWRYAGQRVTRPGHHR